MSILTPFLQLFKWNTNSDVDLNSEFDIDTALNGNWDKEDNAVKRHEDRLEELAQEIIEKTSR